MLDVILELLICGMRNCNKKYLQRIYKYMYKNKNKSD